MTQLTLDLPEDLRSKLESRAAEIGHHSLEQYVQALLRCEADAATSANEDFGAPGDLSVSSSQALESLLLEGENSGRATEMTDADWDSVRQEVASKIAAHRKR